MTHVERIERTIAALRKAIESGMFDAAEIRDIEYAIACATAELEAQP